MATAIEVRDPDEDTPSRSAGPVAIAITPRPIGDTEFRIIADIGIVSEAAGCNCNASDDNPY